MSVISTLIEPHRVTRVFFDCRALSPIPPTWAHRAGDSPVAG
jgi:hypothetical protein